VSRLNLREHFETLTVMINPRHVGLISHTKSYGIRRIPGLFLLSSSLRRVAQTLKCTENISPSNSVRFDDKEETTYRISANARDSNSCPFRARRSANQLCRRDPRDKCSRNRSPTWL